jgi:hypothetical protein
MAAEEIRDWLERYVDCRVSLEEFEDWFLPATWDVSKANSQAQEMASEIRLYLAEVDRGDRSQDQLRTALSELIARHDRRISTGAS